MRDGFIKVAVATPDIQVANCQYNAEQIAGQCRSAWQEGAQLLVLPELCLTAYGCGDLFLQPTLLEGAAAGLEHVLQASRHMDMLIAVGLPVVHQGKLYNCAAVLQGGRVLGVVPKSHLPSYGEFDESRQFISAFALGAEPQSLDAFGQKDIPFGSRLLFRCRELPEFVLGVEICEDLWVPSPPSSAHALAGATVLANLSASDELIGKAAYRRSLVTGQSARQVCAYLYANAGWGESTTDTVFAAHNLVAENGALLAESQRFASGLTTTEIDVWRLAHERRRMQSFAAPSQPGYRHIHFSQPVRETRLTRSLSPTPFIPADEESRKQTCESILQIQSHGLATRLAHVHAQTAVIGVSGGLDSTLALLVAVRAMALLGRPGADVLAVTMPGFGTTPRTRTNAELLCKELGVTLRTVDISASVCQHFADIGQDEGQHDVTYENSQARERTQVLMDLANMTNGLVVGTGDLSELALGWATYNGDHMSMYAVNASVPKTLVRYLVAFEAEHSSAAARRAVLEDILDTPVSPELLPPKEGNIAQVTEELVGPYELHDFFLYYGIRWGFAPRKVVRLAIEAFAGRFGREQIVSWCKVFYRRFFSQQFKRSCLPDGPKVGSVSLSPRGDWRMPSDAVAALWLAELERL